MAADVFDALVDAAVTVTNLVGVVNVEVSCVTRNAVDGIAVFWRARLSLTIDNLTRINVFGLERDTGRLAEDASARVMASGSGHRLTNGHH